MQQRRNITPTTVQAAPQQRQNKGGLVGFLSNAVTGNWPGAAASLLGVPELEGLAQIANSAVTGGSPTTKPEDKVSDKASQAAPQELPQPVGHPLENMPQPIPGLFPQPPMNTSKEQKAMVWPGDNPQYIGNPGQAAAGPGQPPVGFYTPPPFHLMQKYGNWWA